MEKEIWKDIPSFEGLYQASNFGRIKSFWFWSNYTNNRVYREKILKPKYSKDKCGRVELWRGGEHKTYLTYRLVLCAFTNKPYEYEMTVNHKDGNRLNNNISNLEWLSRADNIRYGFENGQYKSNKVEITNKLTNEITNHISQTKASRYMGVNDGYISNKVKNGKYENKDYKWRIID